MSYKVVLTDFFAKNIKKLYKKHKSIKADLLQLVELLEESPKTGTSLGKDCYKIRLNISSKSAGKSGGARVITCVKVVNEHVYLLTIYDKSEKETISDKELTELIGIISDKTE